MTDLNSHDAKDLLNILNSIQVRGDQAERIVELKIKLKALIETDSAPSVVSN